MCHVTLTVMSWGTLSCTFPHPLSEAKTPASPLPGFLPAMHAHTHSHTHAQHAHIHTCTHSHLNTYTCTHAQIYLHIFTNTCTHLFKHILTHMPKHTYIYTRTYHRHTHAHIHLHTNTHSHTCTQFAYYFSSPELDCVSWAVDTSPSLEGAPNYSCFPLSELVVRSTWPELLKTPATLMSQAMLGQRVLEPFPAGPHQGTRSHFQMCLFTVTIPFLVWAGH